MRRKAFAACIALALVISARSPSAQLQFVTIDVPGATYTSVNGGPSPEGDIVGTYVDGVTFHSHGFVRSRGGVFTTIDYPGASATSVNGWISPRGTIVGSYFIGSRWFGFTLYRGVFTSINYPGSTSTTLAGINPGGDIVGNYCVPGTCGVFVRSARGTFTPLTIPNGVLGNAATINPSGAVVAGCSVDNRGHLCIVNNDEVTLIDFPGATYTTPGAGNPENDVAGGFGDQQNRTHGFMYSHAQGIYTQIDVPGARYTFASGISPQGIVVGIYQDAAVKTHGFMTRP